MTRETESPSWYLQENRKHGRHGRAQKSEKALKQKGGSRRYDGNRPPSQRPTFGGISKQKSEFTPSLTTPVRWTIQALLFDKQESRMPLLRGDGEPGKLKPGTGRLPKLPDASVNTSIIRVCQTGRQWER
jgi:hypothetical protein